MHRVLIVAPIAPAGEPALGQAVDVIRAPDSTPDTIRRLTRDADGVMISNIPDGNAQSVAEYL